MTIQDLIQLTKNQIASMQASRSQAFQIGDAQMTTDIEARITQAEITLLQLQSVLD